MRSELQRLLAGLEHHAEPAAAVGGVEATNAVVRRPWEEQPVSAKQGDLALLEDPVARVLLSSTIPARLAYTWLDGTPRVVPIWFYWNGTEFVFGTPPRAPKLKALARNPAVALTIDDVTAPYKALLVRGTATVEIREGVIPEYAAAAERYLGKEEGRATVAFVAGRLTHMARVAVRPEWVGLLDFQTRFPSALSHAPEAADG